MTPGSPQDTRTALVTGAARGIGRATAQALLDRGWRVGAFDVDPAGLADLAGSGGAVTGALDVRDADGWAEALRTTCGDGPLDLLVNNAGVLVAGAFEEIPLERQRALVDVNVTGVLTGCHASFPHLRRSRAALVVNLCSASAIYGQPELATYSATKFAVRGLTEALDLEWARHGIAVQALWPLFVATAMVDGVSTGTTRSLGVRLSERDVAEALLALVDDHDARPRPRAVGSPHHPVGRQARLMAGASQVAPHWINRLTTRLLARD
ncbi:SDR family oxidoreductase [Nocardioides pantholopis]|uniref:SDR family oxidoreductase n=1 Tax=Nocardioides pantholopis TaxID=2483798 RepID=UPI000F081E3D|nr:SDR family oxidoreductase [Nocardioides pantholopis]